MDNPYEILGISSSATDDEVTVAYRKLAKKYHPDLNPGDKTAEQKMQKVNSAYEQIKNQRTGGAKYERSDGSYGPRERPSQGRQTYRGDDPFGGFDFGGFDFGDIFGGAWQQQSQRGPSLEQVRQYIQTGRFHEAQSILDRITHQDGTWHYFSALAHAGTGNRVTALRHAQSAVRMEPDNMEFQNLLDRYQAGNYTYQQTGQRYGFDMQTVGSTMLRLFVAQLVCLFCCRTY